MSRKALLSIIIIIFVLGFYLVIGSNTSEEQTTNLYPSSEEPNVVTPSSAQKKIAALPLKQSLITTAPSSLESEAHPPWKGLKNSALRSAPVQLDPFLRSGQTFSEGEALSFNLFDDISVDSTVSESFENVNGTISTTARIVGSKYGRVFIAQTNGELRVKINIPEQNKIFAIHYNPADQTYYSLELDPSLEEPDVAGVHVTESDAEARLKGLARKKSDVVGAAELESLREAAADESEATVIIDVMVLYTNIAFSEVGSLANMQNLIAIGMAMGNDAHDNTETGISIHLVHSALLDYNDDLSKSKNQLLDYLTDNDGIMDEAHTLRDTYGADFVSLIIGNGASSSGGGLGWTLQSLSGRADLAFSVLDENIYDGYSPIHEIGHNMGLDHAPDQINSSPGPTGLPIGNDAAGWHWHPTAGQPGYCSVMAYNNGFYYLDGLDHARVGLFSDPNRYHETKKTGDDTLANNARVLRLLKNIYANYRSRDLGGDNFLVEAPNDSVVLTAGNNFDIVWNSEDVVGNVKIELYRNNILQQVIASNTLNDRRYTWSIPSDFAGDNLVVRVSSVNNAAIYDESDNTFEIHKTFYNELLDSEPANMATTGDWEFGPWTNSTGLYGGPDSANTGTNIYDTDLDFISIEDSILTLGPIDCSAHQQVQLHFKGWYAIHTGFTAKVEYKTGTGSWQPLYSRDGSFYFNSWTNFSYNLSPNADNASQVYIRWIYENVTEGNMANAGMSIDDISLTGTGLPPQMGDVDGDNDVDLADAIRVAQLLTGQAVTITTSGDVNGDGIISMVELIFIIQSLMAAP